jgi:PqqD family protein of HPr-rel-A system
MDGHRFRLAAPGMLLWREWDDGCVVFNRATGETHYLDNFTAYVLRLLETEARTLDDLIDTICAGLGQERGAVIEGQVITALRNFEALALVDSGG